MFNLVRQFIMTGITERWNNPKEWIAASVITLVSVALSAATWSSLPERMIIHWNMYGEADGYSSKFFGALIIPSVSVLILLLLVAIPRIDPSGNIGGFWDQYRGLVNVIQLYFLYFNSIYLALNLGYQFSIMAALAPALAVMFYYIGTIMEKAKQNWFVGVRTPWTLSSEEVWVKTHLMAGKVFKVSGLFTFLGLLVPELAFWVIIIPVLLGSLYLILYSYQEYQRMRAK